MLATPVFKKQRQEFHKFKTNLDYIVETLPQKESKINPKDRVA